MSGRRATRWPSGVLLLSLLALATPKARAQDSAGVRIDVKLAADSTPRGAREPIIFTRNLLADSPWLSMLRSGFPVRLHYRVELWRSRAGWFDEMVRFEEWDVAVRHEPLLEQYTVTRVENRRRSQNRYATPGTLAAALSLGYQVRMRPLESGTYYYVASLDVTTLSDTDLDELERFFRGELETPDSTAGSGSTVSRGARRLLLRLAGLPTQRLEGRCDVFEVR